jgi:hypothetical protein
MGKHKLKTKNAKKIAKATNIKLKNKEKPRSLNFYIYLKNV